MTDFQPDDVVMGANGNLYLVEADRYNGRPHFVPLIPIAAAQHNPPEGAVLIRRHVDGKPLPVLNLGDGELYAVKRTVA